MSKKSRITAVSLFVVACVVSTLIVHSIVIAADRLNIAPDFLSGFLLLLIFTLISSCLIFFSVLILKKFEEGMIFRENGLGWRIFVTSFFLYLCTFLANSLLVRQGLTTPIGGIAIQYLGQTVGFTILGIVLTSTKKGAASIETVFE
ncbi:hypothetical protein LP7551_02098 [Roseibium album]|nr:hypothetical protein LP7551_02098 [Roseibium album]